MKHGIDTWSGYAVINWGLVKQVIDFAIHRATYGSPDPKQIDPQFETNYKACKTFKIPQGAYHLTYAKTVAEAIIEANFFLSQLKGKQFEYPVCLDMEDVTENGIRIYDNLTTQQRTDIAYAFLDTVEKAGYYVCLYTSPNWKKNKLDMSRLSRFDIWEAWYSDTSTPSNTDMSKECGMWQFCSDGKINGINHAVTCDIAYKDYPSIIAAAGLNGFSKTSTSTNVSRETPLKVGDKVEVLQAINYDNGKPFTQWYKQYDLLEVKGNRAVIGIGNVVTAPVNLTYLRKC